MKIALALITSDSDADISKMNLMPLTLTILLGMDHMAHMVNGVTPVQCTVPYVVYRPKLKLTKDMEMIPHLMMLFFSVVNKEATKAKCTSIELFCCFVF